MHIRVLGAHHCESRNSKLTSLLIDDIIAIDAGSLTSSLSLPKQLELRAILLTHQHYDHIRDIPAVAMNFAIQNTTVNIYSTQSVHDVITNHLLNGKLYPKFLEQPQGNPAVRFTLIEPHKPQQIEGYNILAVPVNHLIPAVGYQVASPDGKRVFYTGDTGPGLAACWEHVSPQLLITEVTAPNKYEEFARESGHLTPNLLKQEITTFQGIKGYMPPVVAAHLNPGFEKEIEAEIAIIAKDLNNSINLAYEGMQLHI